MVRRIRSVVFVLIAAAVGAVLGRLIAEARQRQEAGEDIASIDVRAAREAPGVLAVVWLLHVAIASLEELQTLTAAIVAIEGVRKTTSTFTVATPIPHRVEPLLRKVTMGAGWGRSTPTPREDE